MKRCAMLASVGVILLALPTATAQRVDLPPLRPPAVPLVTHDPYFSVWSFNDKLTDGWPRHWTGSVQAMCGMLRIDGKPYRFAGVEPRDVPAMTQKSVTVTPTRTIYEFEASGIVLTLTFTTPLLPDDLDLISRPVTYVSWALGSTAGRSQQVAVYFDFSAEWAVNTSDQRVMTSRHRAGNMTLLRVGTADQPVLAKSGDNLRIDWGYFTLALPASALARGLESVIAGHSTARHAFARDGKLPESDDLRFPRAANDDWPVLAAIITHDNIATAQPAEDVILLAYDEPRSIEHFDRRLRPYWRRAGKDIASMLSTAYDAFPSLAKRCQQFDDELIADLEKTGGEKYARLATLAYRQCFAAHKLAADWDGTPLMFSKENFSNGCIGTVDVTYPSSPFFLLLNPTLLKAQLAPVLDYAASPRWKFPFAPHDLGTYPLANGQVYGGGEKTEENQMPVEECGNMLLMLTAIAQTDGNADYPGRYLPTLRKWAEYLREKGLDPENQLCTDDFAGHLAHNTNLSIKAILALGGYGQILKALGQADEAAQYDKLARDMATRWQQRAADGEHYKLAFDKPGTWSQKYNLVWDQVLGLKLFPPEVARREIAFYKTKLNRFGLPLDNREAYAKLDWTVWTATMATDRADFRALVDPLYEFAHGSPSRVPLTDWYSTVDAKQIGFQARSVVGGVYMPLLANPAIREKWSGRAGASRPTSAPADATHGSPPKP